MLKVFIPCDSVARAVGADQVAEAVQREAERRQLAVDIQRCLNAKPHRGARVSARSRCTMCRRYSMPWQARPTSMPWPWGRLSKSLI